MTMTVDADWELEGDVWTLPFPFEEHWRPQRPLAARRKAGGYYRTTRERALTLPYLESNPKAMTSLVITDHDGGRADEIAALCGLPVPSYIAMNPHTRDGHIVYALKTPVILTNPARREPVHLLARVEAGLNNVLAGDVAYAHKFTKNPTHIEHMTLWGPDYAVYDLKDLWHPISKLGALPKYSTTKERRKALASSGTGRNVDLFDLVRQWSYRRRGDFDDWSAWHQLVDDHAWDRNIDIIGPAYTKGPMDPTEVRALARSISAWTWRRIKRTFSEEQARRGRASAAKLTADQRREKASKAGQTMTDARREANRQRATIYDESAIIAAAMEG
ncbi:replication initiation protein [Nocardia cyriacigeorgica]|uniref:replication initiation protein n=1 Tax=Nocardia cyriacigeorgica TaxID=135487 RepID=UPI0024565400|nr:replication initiation protein [Nocardia cyriacigeorgica]